ncbi:MAG: hypothetical protein LC649_09350 [Bacteroidales bacterium]|nr:hypothetical protein [Bacteroidales bacterium]
MKNLFQPILFLTIIILLAGCGSGSNKKNNSFQFPEADSFPVSEAQKLSQEAIEDIIQNISSPVEIAMLLQALEVPFLAEHLASTSNAENLSTSFIKAVKLGVYGADLGYLNIYEKTSTAIDNLTTINKLADELRVGQFFDFETLKSLAVNRSNLDSLMFMSVHSYNLIDDYLRETNRGHLSALMITGVWIEAQYLACKVVGDYPHEELKTRIGEQKIILNDLLMLLAPYRESGQDYSRLYTDFERIKEAYAPVKITYRPGESETVNQDGRLIFIQNEESVIEMTSEQMKEIIRVTTEVRNRIISY